MTEICTGIRPALALPYRECNKLHAGVRDVAPPDLEHHPAHVRADVPQHFYLQEIK